MKRRKQSNDDIEDIDSDHENDRPVAARDNGKT
jgi:hypothetical protein